MSNVKPTAIVGSVNVAIVGNVMKISVFSIVAVAAFSAGVAVGEPMFDQSLIRETAATWTCQDWTDALTAKELRGNTPQEIALEGAYLGYVNGLLDAMIAVSDQADRIDDIVRKVVFTCAMEPNEKVSNVMGRVVFE